MKAFTMRRAAWMLALALLVAFTLVLCVLSAGAETECLHAEGYENGFCRGQDCGAYQPAPLNEGVYEISNAGQLYYVADLMRTNGDTVLNAKLMCNITVNADLLKANGQPRTGAMLWEPIGNGTEGAKNITLDGQGYYISGLYAKYEDGRDVGLFGTVIGGDSGLTVNNLGIIDSYFYSNSGQVGGIVGNGMERTQIAYCYVDAALEGLTGCIGGIAGALDSATDLSRASYCYTTYSKIAGGAEGGSFANCYYFSDSAEDDGEAGTAYFKSDLKLADESLLLEALSAGEKTWVISCRTGLPALLIEHIYAYDCTPECMTCGDENRVGQKAHTYRSDCEEACEVCHRRRVAPESHTAYTSCGEVCRYCGAEMEAVSGHIYTSECDDICDCGFQRTTAVPHVYDGTCDGTCNLCPNRRTPGEHTFDHNCDTVCNTCGITRPVTHTYANACDTDCDVCGKKREVADHVFGEYTVTKAATSLKNGEEERTCSVCGHKETRPVARTGVAIWVVVLSGVGAGLALSVGGFALYWFVIKKRSFAQFIGKKPIEKKEKKK